MPRVLRSPEGKVKRKKRMKLLVAGVIVLAAGIVGGLSWLSYRPAAVISEVRVEGSEGISAESIKARVRGMLAGRNLYLFARANAFLYPKEEIAAALAADFPRAENIALSLDGLRTLVVSIREREGETLWCADAQTSACYFLDENGFIFDHAPKFSGNAYFSHYGGLNASTSPIGANLLPQENFRELSGFIEKARGLELAPLSIHIGNEQYAELILDEGWRLKFHLDQNFTELAGNLAALAHSEEWGKALRGEALDGRMLEYMDLRFGSKVYYKFKE